MEFKTGINDLPVEVIVLIFKELQHKDIFENCSNTCHKWRDIVIHYFIQPYLKKLAKHHLDLRRRFEIAGWNEDCHENEVILNTYENYMDRPMTQQEVHLQIEHTYEFDVEKARKNNMWAKSPILLLPAVLTILGFLYLALRRYGILHKY